MSQTPQAFAGAPACGARHPQPTAPGAYVQEPKAHYAPRLTGHLSVHADGSVYIDAKSAQLLPPGDNTIDLRTPVNGANWHLDCRPGGLCPRRPNGASGGVKFRAKERVRLLLGCVPGPINFDFEHVGNGLFRLYPRGGDKQ